MGARNAKDLFASLPPETREHVLQGMSLEDWLSYAQTNQMAKTQVTHLLVRLYRDTLMAAAQALLLDWKDYLQPFPTSVAQRLHLPWTKHLTLPWLAQHAASLWPHHGLTSQVISPKALKQLREPLFIGSSNLVKTSKSIQELLYEQVPAQKWTWAELFFKVVCRYESSLARPSVRGNATCAFLARLCFLWCHESTESIIACQSHLLLALANVTNDTMRVTCATLLGYTMLHDHMQGLDLEGWTKEWFMTPFQESLYDGKEDYKQFPLLLQSMEDMERGPELYLVTTSEGLAVLFSYWFLPVAMAHGEEIWDSLNAFRRPGSFGLTAFLLPVLDFDRCVLIWLATQLPAAARPYVNDLIQSAFDGGTFWQDYDLFHGHIFTLLTQCYMAFHPLVFTPHSQQRQSYLEMIQQDPVWWPLAMDDILYVSLNVWEEMAADDNELQLRSAEVAAQRLLYAHRAREYSRNQVDTEEGDLLGQQKSLNDFVPQDGRTQFEGNGLVMKPLPEKTTLFHARVDPTPEHGAKSGPFDVYSRFYGLTLSHPCTVLLQYIHEKKSTGMAKIFEYETRRPLRLRPWGYHKYDELYLPNVSNETIEEDMSIVRAYNIDRQFILRARILGHVRGNDQGGRDRGKDQLPIGRDSDLTGILNPKGLYSVSIGADRFDRDYQHMRQLWQKANSKSWSIEGMTLQAALCGSDEKGRSGRLQRYAYYIYDGDQSPFLFNKPIVYRDEEHDIPRVQMPYLVGMLVVYLGTAMELSGDQGECVGCVMERGYESRVLTLVDTLLTKLPLVPHGGAMCFPNNPGLASHLPLFRAYCDQNNVSIL